MSQQIKKMLFRITNIDNIKKLQFYVEWLKKHHIVYSIDFTGKYFNLNIISGTHNVFSMTTDLIEKLYELTKNKNTVRRYC